MSVIRQHKQTLSAIYTPYYLAAFASLLVKKKRQPTIFHFHGDHAITKIDHQEGFFRIVKFAYIWIFGKIIAHLQTSALNAVNSIIFVAPEARLQIEKKYNLKSVRQRSFIVPNGVSLDTYHPEKNRNEKLYLEKLTKRYRLTKKHTVVLYSGRIDQKKGIDKIINALGILQKGNKRASYFLFVMHPTYKDKDSARYFAYLKKVQARNHIKIQFVSQPKSLTPYYQIADICILPSEQEMMPLVMLESLASGTPFFGTKVGNMPRLLKTIDKKLILEKQDVQSIVSAITWWQLLRSKEKQQIKKGCIALGKQFSWHTTAQKVMRVISLALD